MPTKFVLEYYNRTQWEGKVKIIIRKVEDSLIEDWGSDNDIILMNPPFVSFELLKEPKRKDSVMEVMQRFGGIRKPNQAAAFFVKSIDSLSSNGVIGTILPSSLLYANQYREMRAKIQEVMAKYGLEDVDRQYVPAVKEIAKELSGTGLMSAGATLGGANEKDLLKVQMYYQKAIIDQNFIIIRQLDQLCKIMEQK